MILSDYFRPYVIRTLSFVDCFQLSRIDFMALFHYGQFPRIRVRSSALPRRRRGVFGACVTVCGECFQTKDCVTCCPSLMCTEAGAIVGYDACDQDEVRLLRQSSAVRDRFAVHANSAAPICSAHSSVCGRGMQGVPSSSPHWGDARAAAVLRQRRPPRPPRSFTRRRRVLRRRCRQRSQALDNVSRGLRYGVSCWRRHDIYPRSRRSSPAPDSVGWRCIQQRTGVEHRPL
jgi:hypothetical protein